jgi:flagella basal body P-ring formation protein FlgA
MHRLLLPLVLIGASPALAQERADLAAIDRMVAQFTGVPLGEPGGAAMPIDRRLRLVACTSAPALHWYGAAREAVEVRCPVPGGWKLYVPLAGNGPGGSVSSQPAISRGDALTIQVSGAGFAVAQQGEALEGGPLGGWIKVRGAANGSQVLRARVLRPGLVGIELP